jgi:hypothetical protein
LSPFLRLRLVSYSNVDRMPTQYYSIDRRISFVVSIVFCLFYTTVLIKRCKISHAQNNARTKQEKWSTFNSMQFNNLKNVHGAFPLVLYPHDISRKLFRRLIIGSDQVVLPFCKVKGIMIGRRRRQNYFSLKRL